MFLNYKLGFLSSNPGVITDSLFPHSPCFFFSFANVSSVATYYSFIGWDGRYSEVLLDRQALRAA